MIFLLVVTPADYEPPGFVAAEEEGFVFEHNTENIKVGDVATVSEIACDLDVVFVANAW